MPSAVSLRNSQPAGSNDPFRSLVGTLVALVMGHHQDNVVFFGRGDHAITIFQVGGHWFFGQHVQPAPGALNGHLRVKTGRRADADGIKTAFIQHGFPIRIMRRNSELFAHLPGSGRIHIASGNDLGFRSLITGDVAALGNLSQANDANS